MYIFNFYNIAESLTVQLINLYITLLTAFFFYQLVILLCYYCRLIKNFSAMITTKKVICFNYSKILLYSLLKLSSRACKSASASAIAVDLFASADLFTNVPAADGKSVN